MLMPNNPERASAAARVIEDLENGSSRPLGLFMRQDGGADRGPNLSFQRLSGCGE